MAPIYDTELWLKYPQFRTTWFSKLYVAQEMFPPQQIGISGVGIPQDGRDYIIRPIYNLHGMGSGATIVHSSDFNGHYNIPIGHFFCPYIKGQHWSIDYELTGDKYEVSFACLGRLQNQFDLVKWDSWEVAPKATVYDFPLPYKMSKEFAELDIKHINVEYIICEKTQSQIMIEVHFRHNTDFDNTNNAYKIWPIWNTDSIERVTSILSRSPKVGFKPDLDDGDPALNQHIRYGFLYEYK